MMICNNDRFQLLLGGDGNIDNFLIQVVGHREDSLDKIKDRNNTETTLGNFVMIDNIGNITSIKNPSILGYINKVECFIAELLIFLRN